jgi:methylamine dehydrogenase heavy chain
MPIQYRPLMTGSADGKLIFIQNATPATSITVTNPATKTSAELASPGCYGTYPSVKNALRVSTMCGDGTMGTYTLNAAATEGARQASDKFFDADKDAWFIHGEVNGDNYQFISFQGSMHTVNLDGEKGKLIDSFSMTEGVEGNWRPGGYQPVAVSNGTAYVLMHSNGAEGTHKNPSEEVWSVDLAAKKVVARSKVPTLFSMTVKGDTLYGINLIETTVVKLKIDPATKAVTVDGTSKVGETASQIEVSN